MNKFIPLLLNTVLILFPFMAQANWVEVIGKSYIENDDIEQARRNAIDDALLNADFQYGVHVTNQYEIVDGKLVNASTVADQRTKENTDFELANEDLNDDELIIGLRVFIDGLTQNREPRNLYKKQILVPQTVVLAPQQLAYGQINQFGSSISKKLSTLIDEQSKTAYSASYPYQKLDFTPSKLSTNNERLPQWLGVKTESQYVIIPELIDASSEQTSSFGLFSSTNRQFQLKLSLYHSISGEKVWQKSYSTQAEWEFARNQIVTTTTNLFWSSEYGEKVSRVLQQAARDLGRFVSYRSLMGQIIAKKQNKLLLNIGRKNGLNVNDTLKIILKRDLPDRLQAIRLIAESSEAKVIVKQITEDTALVEWLDHSRMESIQIGDIAIAR
ncbi:flagellar assembly protein T N-terminal domain-containing protein [Shewanella sp. 202IG2-18]|uniref:flagellar assembly protein T N-terminal domain-containing protein n=1 Tax=Parashewanella hymeniacidonis TaxID=2807618 RepID=UPI00195F7DE5|nr:flagellar assembly protein T N-terminal domain-containing protein [Parashewanella hymeniacidonis]MBM7073066.1 flagellar assembly protein T N-terminal domain-containing protein [Parashewanella hymeniacidonis]